jgi:hypothetical protein
VVVPPEVVGVEEEEDAAAGLIADSVLLFGSEALARRSVAAPGPSGLRTTQRLPSGIGEFSSSRKPSFCVKKAMASSYP